MFKTILKTVKQEKTKSSISETPKLDDDLVIQQESVPKKTQFNVKQINLEDHRIASIKDVFYIKDFISKEQGDYLFNSIYSHNRWNVLQHAKRRVQKLGGEVTSQGLQDVEALPSFIQELCVSLQSIAQKPINHVLINEYEKGIGIMPHTDGPLYHGFVIIISLGSPVVFKFSKNEQALSLLVEPQSVLVFTGEAYTEWLHSIEYFDEDSIFFDYQDSQVIRSSISNFPQSHLASLVQVTDQEETQINQNLTLLKLENHEYGYVLLLKRTLRLSLTLRHVNPQ